MQYTDRYDSPLGSLLLAADAEGLTGLWMEGQKYFARGLDPHSQAGQTPALRAARQWLDCYFGGKEPAAAVPLHLTGTPFQRAVWEALRAIPWGQTVSYGALARQLEARGFGRVSARAVGGAVGRNPVSIIVPCHRVVGADGRLTGYAGGLERKRWLLELEGGV